MLRVSVFTEKKKSLQNKSTIEKKNDGKHFRSESKNNMKHSKDAPDNSTDPLEFAESDFVPIYAKKQPPEVFFEKKCS